MYPTKIKVLLVENVRIAQKAAKLMLLDLNCDVDTADTGLEALQKSTLTHYDIIFMDLGLEDMDGLTVTKIIREGEKRDQAIPIIALTAHGGEDIQASCFSAGMNDFINKPIEIEVAKRIFNQYLSLSKQ